MPRLRRSRGILGVDREDPEGRRGQENDLRISIAYQTGDVVSNSDLEAKIGKLADKVAATVEGLGFVVSAKTKDDGRRSIEFALPLEPEEELLDLQGNPVEVATAPAHVVVELPGVGYGTHFGCVCGEKFGAFEDKAKTHVEACS